MKTKDDTLFYIREAIRAARKMTEQANNCWHLMLKALPGCSPYEFDELKDAINHCGDLVVMLAPIADHRLKERYETDRKKRARALRAEKLVKEQEARERKSLKQRKAKAAKRRRNVRH